MVISDEGDSIDFANNYEIIKSIDKDILTFRTNGLNLIECLESGISTFKIYFDEVINPAESTIIDLYNTLNGYL